VEKGILDHIQAPPNVRLGCQLRPAEDLLVVPILPVETKAADEGLDPNFLAGREQDIVVLFADLRGFTRIAEDKLPYDVVFLLNRYFDVVGDAIELAGGTANQFTGDGVMALFGMEAGPEVGCRQALAAACEIIRGLEELSQAFSGELQEPLKAGIGIHTGQAVVGHMGHGIATYLTAVGDTVHVASRFQELTKEYRCQMVISDLVARRAGIDASGFDRHQVTVRNRERPLAVRTIGDLEMLNRCLSPVS
jgi:adenylate cyclase